MNTEGMDSIMYYNVRLLKTDTNMQKIITKKMLQICFILMKMLREKSNDLLSRAAMTLIRRTYQIVFAKNVVK